LATDTPIVELVGVTRTFAVDPPFHALREVRLRVQAHECVAVVGPSGSGKSTLLNVIGCLDRPSSGIYRFDGVDVAELDDAQRASLRGTRIGFVFQSFHLLAHRSVVDNVMLAELYRRPSRAERASRRARALGTLERVGLAQRAEYLPGKLSGGERQRVAIARALMGTPRLLLCDEPTGNLDSVNTIGVLNLIDELRADGLTVMIITHDDTVAAHAGRTVRMIDGQLFEQSPRMEMLPA
jgi:putative ABC transport system ATP-binding protein